MTDDSSNNEPQKNTVTQSTKNGSITVTILKTKNNTVDPKIKKLDNPALIGYPQGYQPAIIHANFNPNNDPIDPTRPLDDIPEPAPRLSQNIAQIFANTGQAMFENDRDKSHRKPQSSDKQSKWDLIKSAQLAEHLNQLKADGKLSSTSSLFKKHNELTLLEPLKSIQLIDMADIQAVIEMLADNQFRFVRQGFITHQAFIEQSKSDENIAEEVPLWQSILYPSDVQGLLPLDSDVMSISMVYHALKQCQTRATINKTLTATKICDYVRSYVLAQCKLFPANIESFKHTPIYSGHVIVVAQLLGWERAITADNEVVFNISSRSALFASYPVLSDYVK